MKLTLIATRLVFVLAFVAALIAFTAFRQKDTVRQNTFRNSFAGGNEDTTTPGKRHPSQNEYHLDQLDIHMKILDDQIIGLEKEIQQPELSKIKATVEGELRKIDLDKVSTEVEEALARIDVQKMVAEINKSNTRAAKINMDELKKEMEKIRSGLRKEKLGEDIDFSKIERQVNEGLASARKDMRQARDEMQVIKNFADALNRDGLIDKTKPFKIEAKDGELYLNDVKQSKDVQEKYGKYLLNKSFKLDNSNRQ